MSEQKLSERMAQHQIADEWIAEVAALEAKLEAMELAAQTLALDLAGQIDTTEKRQSLANRLVKEHLAAQQDQKDGWLLSDGHRAGHG